MNTDNPLFVTLAVCGTAGILTGIFTKIFPPKKINIFYGHRTRTSMKNQRNWDYAQKHFASELIKAGVLMILFSFFGLMITSTEVYWMVMALIFISIILFYFSWRTDRAVKKFETKNPEI